MFEKDFVPLITPTITQIVSQETGFYYSRKIETKHFTFRSKNLVIRYGKPFKVTDMDIKNANELLYNTVKSLMEENLK